MDKKEKTELPGADTQGRVTVIYRSWYNTSRHKVMQGQADEFGARWGNKAVIDAGI